MESKFLMRRLKALLPVAGIVVLAVVAVTTAMTILGGDAPGSPVIAPSVAATVPGGSQSAPPSAAASIPGYSPGYMEPLPSTPPVVRTERRRERDPDGVWYVDFSYPQFQPDTTPLGYIVNQDIASEIDTRIAAFEGGPAAVRQVPGKRNQLTGSYGIDMLSPDLVSFTLRWVDDTAIDHPAMSVETLNYALNTGQRLDFGAIFADQPGAFAVLSEQSRIQLRQSLGNAYDQTAAELGTSPIATNFTNWALTEAGLKITFSEFQVGDYATGTPFVVVSWSDLKLVMRPDGPVSRLAGFPAGT
jgi:hypothetical protein